MNVAWRGRRRTQGRVRMPSSSLVSVVLPVLDEIDAIEECLDRIARQTWPHVEVIVADGGSTDGTRELLAERAATDHRLRVVDNPGRLQSAGLNRALALARGEMIVRLDARSFITEDYVASCATLLADRRRAVVGGRMVPRGGNSIVASGIAAANQAWWGAGPARFHREGEAGPAETVYLGAFQRCWLDAVGGWAEDVGVNEDYELNHRIRSRGGVVWLDPTLEVGYQPRTHYRALARQYFRYGRSKAVVMRRHPRSVRPRQAAPAALAAVGVLALTAGRPGRVARAALLLHAGAVTVAAAAERIPWRTRLVGAAAGIVMHWSWSCGWWWGQVRPVPMAGADLVASPEDAPPEPVESHAGAPAQRRSVRRS